MSWKKTPLLDNWVFLLSSAGTVWIFALMALINCDILLRALFHAPIEGVTEIIELSIGAIVFLQLSEAVSSGRLTRSDGLYSRILERKPVAGHSLGLLFDLAGAGFFLAILCGGVPTLIEAYTRDFYAGNRGLVVIPLWPLRAIMCAGLATGCIVFLRLAWKHCQALKRIKESRS